MGNFEEFAKTRLDKHGVGYVIEGHYHQDRFIECNGKVYFNLNSYAVNDKIYMVEFKEDKIFLKKIEID